METTKDDRNAFALAHLREELEKQIENTVRQFEEEHGGPIELDMSMIEGEGGAAGDDALRKHVETIVEAFHRKSLVAETGLRVHKVTAIDSDEDGTVAVRVSYDYAIED